MSRALFLDHDKNRLVRDLVTLSPIGLQPLVRGDKEIVYDIAARQSFASWNAAAVRLGIGIVEDSTGSNRAKAGTWHIRYEQNVTAGPLVVGKRYLIQTYNDDDDFTNVGAASNASGVVFTATGTAPTNWLNVSILWPISEELDFDANAADVQAAIRAISDAFEALTVIGSGPFTLIGGTYEALEAFTVYAANLVPQCVGSWQRLEAGDGIDTAEKQQIDFKQASCAETSTGTLLSTGSYSVETVVTGVVDETSCVLRISANGSPYSGAISLNDGSSYSTPIPFNPTTAQLVAALESIDAIGEGNVSVTAEESGPSRFSYLVTLAASIGNFTTLNVNDSAVSFAVVRRFVISTNTGNMADALARKTQVQMLMELEVTIGDSVETEFQQAILIPHDLLNGAATVPSPVTSYLTAAQIAALYPSQLFLAGLTGGGATKLDGQATVGVAVNRLVHVVIGDTLSTYLLRAGTSAEASPGIIRPDDYAASTNEKIYVQVG